jgi:hypothetical protein
VEKYCAAGQTTGDNMVHMLCMLDSQKTNTHSEYVTLIAFPRQQWLHESVSILRSYAHCLSYWTCWKRSSGTKAFNIYTIPQWFLTLSSWRNSQNCFSYPEEPTPTAKFTGQNKLKAESAIQLLLSSLL